MKTSPVRLLIATALLAVVGLSWADQQQMIEAKAAWSPTEAANPSIAKGLLDYLSLTTTDGVFKFGCSASDTVLVSSGRNCLGVLRAAGAADGSVAEIEYVRRDCGLKDCNVLMSLRDAAGEVLISRETRVAALDRGKAPPELWYWAAIALAHGVPSLMAVAIAFGWWPRRD